MRNNFNFTLMSRFTDVVRRSRCVKLWSKSSMGLCVLFLLGTSTGIFLYTLLRASSSISVRCESPRTRREWRTLSTVDKLSYIGSIKCLQDLPSSLETGGSLYDDFPYIHPAVGYTSDENLLNINEIHD